MFAIPQKTSCIRYVLGSQPNGEEFFLIHSLSSIHDQFVVGSFLKSVISFKKHLQWNSCRFRKVSIQLNIAILHLSENRVDSESDFLTGLQGCGSLH
jgi:hypothetical protein